MGLKHFSVIITTTLTCIGLNHKRLLLLVGQKHLNVENVIQFHQWLCLHNCLSYQTLGPLSVHIRFTALCRSGTQRVLSGYSYCTDSIRTGISSLPLLQSLPPGLKRTDEWHGHFSTSHQPRAVGWLLLWSLFHGVLCLGKGLETENVSQEFTRTAQLWGKRDSWESEAPAYCYDTAWRCIPRHFSFIISLIYLFRISMPLIRETQ